MDKIIIYDFLSSLDFYVILKSSNLFPDYVKGSDVDILVLDVEVAIKQMIKFFEDSRLDNFQLRVTATPTHSHFDILDLNNILEIRFDLIDEFNYFTKFDLSTGFKSLVMTTCNTHNLRGRNYNFPSDVLDNVIRYLEYVEYFELFDQKRKHFDYVCNDNKTEVEEVYRIIHLYLRRKRVLYTKKTETRREITISNKKDLLTITVAIYTYVKNKIKLKIRNWFF